MLIALSTLQHATGRECVCLKFRRPEEVLFVLVWTSAGCGFWKLSHGYHISSEMLNLFITLKGHKYACRVCVDA